MVDSVRNFYNLGFISLLFFCGCGYEAEKGKSMWITESEAQEVVNRLEEIEGLTHFKEQWNGNQLIVRTSGLSYEALRQATVAIFDGGDPVLEENTGYEEKHFSLLCSGPNTTAHKTHRWQVDVFNATDEAALDDFGSYVDKELESFVREDDKFIILIYDNSADYDY